MATMKKKKKPAMRSSDKRVTVYDFDDSKDEERFSQQIANKYLSVIADKPNKKCSPVTKYKFLQCFAQDTVSKPEELNKKRLEVEVDHDTAKEGLFRVGKSASSGSSYCVPSTFNESKVVTIDSDDEDDTVGSSASISSCNLARNQVEEQALEHSFSGFSIVHDDDVVVHPDYILYGEICSRNCQITFTSSIIKVDCSAICGNGRPFSIELPVGNILRIESQWCEQFQTAVVDLFILGDNEYAENADMKRGIAALRFALVGPCWPKQQESIKSLNAVYDAKWILVSDIDARSKDGWLENNGISNSKHNFPNSDESVRETIYPRGDPDAVSLGMREIELLQPERFVNDVIIDFYMKYLENKIKPEEKHRFHFFNSFFFRKLADLDRDRRGAGDGRASFRRVRKWTRKVNLFEKDYIFIPVNFSLHWSLIVICHPGEVAEYEDEHIEKLPKVPCILHMDSIKGSHRGLKNIFQSYLWEEWKERGNQSEDLFSKFLHMQFVPLELPQQENSYDCGIFLLHYAELFLEHAPACLNPFKKNELSNFLNKDWFAPVEASCKRTYIKDLICQIIENYQETALPALCDGNKHSPEVLLVEERETGAEVPEETRKLVTRESFPINHISDQGSQLESLNETPKIEHNYRSSSLGEDCRSFGKMILRDRMKSIMTPIEEVDETSGQQTKLACFSSSSEAKVYENHIRNDLFGSNSSGTNDKFESPSTASGELATSVVEDSEEEDGVIDITNDEKCIFREKLGSKRRSPVPREGARRRLRSSSKDLQEVFLCE